MIPVKYAGDPNGDVTPKWVVADTTKKGDWYDYSAKQWANAVTVKADALAKYKGATPGTTVIDNTDVLGYFVYIPRYKYKVMTMSGSTTPTATNFEIQFEKNSATKSVPSAVGDWATHPAFIWGNTELNGFWMGKFETTGKTSSPTIKPNQVANTSNTIGQKFTSAASIGVNDPTADNMGSTVSGVVKNSHNLLVATSHMLKNSEWGAAAYLSASEFGAGYNGVYNNGRYAHDKSYESYDEDGNRSYGGITGCGPGTKGTDINNGSVSFYGGTNLTQSNPVSDTACSTDNLHAYNQELGVLASTTNNVYGIYDMAGGSWEYVMGSYTAMDDQSATKSVDNAVNPPYVNLYLNLTSDTSCTWATCGGAALYETAGWGSDSRFFVDANSPWFIRGGGAYSGTDAGVFALFYSSGTDPNGIGSRVGLRLPASAQ